MAQVPDETGIPKNAHILLWDGECELCRRCVAWVAARDGGKLIYPIPWQEAPSPPIDDALRARARRAAQLIAPDGRRVGAGRACLEVLSLLGWRRTARLLGAPPLLWGVELVYRAIARTRRFWSRVLFAPKR